MRFRLGIVGHRDTLAMISELVNEYFDAVEIHMVEFSNDNRITDAVEEIARLQCICDGILYSRLDPYRLISSRLQHTVPVRYVEIDSSHLLISLLKAAIHYRIEPTNISIDTVDRASTIEALRMVGTPDDRMTIQAVTARLGQDRLVDSALAQHIEHHRNGALLCVTNMMEVYLSLLKLDIPVTMICPTNEAFVHEIRNLMLRHQLRSQEASPLAVMHVRLRYKEKYRFYGEMPIREIDELGSAAKLLAIFAERLDGAMYQLSNWEYLIICSRILLQNTTNQFVDFDLMKSLNQDTVFDAAIGIGCGQTVKEAQSNAVIASNQVTNQPGTNTVVALSPEQLIGPIRPKSRHFSQESTIDTKLEEIALATGLSISALSRIYQATRQYNSSLFTSTELAEALGVTTRTVNRMLERLLDQHYAAIAGRDLASAKGRPARVIRLLF